MRLKKHAKGIAVGCCGDAGGVLTVIVEALVGCHNGLGFFQKQGQGVNVFEDNTSGKSYLLEK